MEWNGMGNERIIGIRDGKIAALRKRRRWQWGNGRAKEEEKEEGNKLQKWVLPQSIRRRVWHYESTPTN